MALMVVGAGVEMMVESVEVALLVLVAMVLVNVEVPRSILVLVYSSFLCKSYIIFGR